MRKNQSEFQNTAFQFSLGDLQIWIHFYTSTLQKKRLLNVVLLYYLSKENLIDVYFYFFTDAVYAPDMLLPIKKGLAVSSLPVK